MDKDPDKFIYPLKRGDKPKNKYASRWYKIPNVEYQIDYTEGNMKRYDLSAQKKTITALDPTFYPQVLEDGTRTTPKFNFHDIVNAEIIVTDVGMQDIVISSDGVKPFYLQDELKDGEEVRTVKRVRMLIFIEFKTKVVVMRYVYYPDDFYCNKWLGEDISFKEGTKDIIVLDTVDPANKNSLAFLRLKDIRIRGNYMFLVDEELNMVLRYDISYLRNQ